MKNFRTTLTPDSVRRIYLGTAAVVIDTVAIAILLWTVYVPPRVTSLNTAFMQTSGAATFSQRFMDDFGSTTRDTLFSSALADAKARLAKALLQKTPHSLSDDKISDIIHHQRVPTPRSRPATMVANYAAVEGNDPQAFGSFYASTPRRKASKMLHD
ncbi:MAG: hypothetical protein ABWY82_26315 [Tardiphaga sp.]